MADQDFKSDVRCYGGPQRVAKCKFVTAGTGAVTGFTAGKGVLSVTRSAVGVFDIVMAHNATDFDVELAYGGAAAAMLGRPTVRSITLATKTIKIAVVDFGGTPADVETTGMTVYVTVHCEGP